MLVNRLYLGEVGFRDVTAVNAHAALVEEQLFEECQRILRARGDIHYARAASNSDYYLTGLITCPHCGNKYVGTSATGKLRRYRYYTCFARTRYGYAGCTGARIDADLLYQAVQEALIDFYGQTDLIDAAVAAERARRMEGGRRHDEERQSLSGQIAAAEAAIDRYRTAFENGTLDERTCGPRVRDLTTKLDQLRARREELGTAPSEPPTAPSPAAIRRLREKLGEVLTNGTPGQRKAIIETHVAEIKIEGDPLIPIFKIPLADDEGPAREADPTFRTTHRVVDRRLRHTNTPAWRPVLTCNFPWRG